MMESEENFVREVVVGTTTLEIIQELLTDVGGVVWDSALVATHYLDKHVNTFLNKKVLELGAGTGVCSLALSCLDIDVTCTDLPERLPLIESNVLRNEHHLRGEIKVTALDWCSPGTLPETDVVLAVDCIYYKTSVNPLIQLLKSIGKPVLCVYEKRDVGEPVDAQRMFLEGVHDYFHVNEVPKTDLDPSFYCEEIRLLWLEPIAQ